MKKFLLLFSILLLFYSRSFAVEGGYMGKLSYVKGDTLDFHISNKLTSYTLRIYRYETTPRLIQTFNNITGTEFALADSSYYYGCRWPVTFSLIIPDSWLSGSYKAEFTTSVGTQTVIFFIREKIPGSFSKVLVVPSTNTWNAYNPYGGKSLYDYNSSSLQRSVKVSFQRPSTQFGSFTEFRKSELLLIQWLAKENIDVEYATNFDIYNEQSLLSNYSLVIIVGHSEYWSYQERVNCETFVRNGGNLLILSGNSVWWQVRYEDNGQTLVCYKDRNLDPLNGVIDSLVTVNFISAPVNKPENSFTGLSFQSGGYVNNNGTLDWANGYGGYSVYNSHHWSYEGTGLKDGDIFGYNEAIVGNEVDGALFNYVNGIPFLTGTDGSPQNFRVTGSSPSYNTYGYNQSPHAFMGSFSVPGGGTVFNASTIYWENGLSSNWYVQTITRNLIVKLRDNIIPPDIYSWTPFVLTNKTIMNENVQINSRDIFVQTPQMFDFTVNAIERPGEDLSFRWEINGVHSDNNSTKNFNLASSFLDHKVNRVKVYVFNNTDTASISWNLVNTELAILSDPANFVLPGTFYFHRLNVFNYFNDSLNFSITGPSWLTITKSGEISGTSGNSGVFPVTVVVTNQHGQSDSVAYALNVAPVFPVELISFKGLRKENSIFLEWKTASETNNFGFDVELRTSDAGNWQKIGFVAGAGNSSSYKYYNFKYDSPEDQTHFFRLKQIDFDGKTTFSEVISLSGAEIPKKFSLLQNYPNPFNPETRIVFSLPVESIVSLKIYNIMGELVKNEIRDKQTDAGMHQYLFNGSDLPSGIYFCSLQCFDLNGTKLFSESNKMILLK